MRIRRANPTDAPALANVQVNCWRATYTGLLPQSLLEELDYAARLDQWHHHFSNAARAAVDHVVDVSGWGVAGFVTAGPSFGDLPGYDAEVFALYLDGHFHGRGWGRQLLATAANELHQRGLRSAVTWTLTGNRACGFYERLGAIPVAKQHLHLGWETVPEVAYGWRSLEVLMSGPINRAEHAPAARWPKRRPLGQAAATKTPTSSPPPVPPTAALGWIAP